MRRAAAIAAGAALLALIAMCSMSLLLVEEKASHSGSSLYGDGNAEVCWNFLKGKGFSDAAAAGVIGNWQVESGIEPRQCQHGTFVGANGESLAFPYDPPEASLSDDYPAALVDNGSFGYGIAQWTYPSARAAWSTTPSRSASAPATSRASSAGSGRSAARATRACSP